MTKKQALFHCKEMAKYGYLTHIMILDIYDEDEDIPDDVMELICHKPTPPKDIIILCGSKLHEQINIATTHYAILLTKDENKN
jgi:hypothetical protein